MARCSRYAGGGLWVGSVLAVIVASVVVGPAALGADRNVLCEEFTANT